MLITRVSNYSGITRTIDLPVTESQMNAYNMGEKSQDAFPNLTPDQREFIMTGITSEEWDELFPSEDEYSEDDGYYDEDEYAF